MVWAVAIIEFRNAETRWVRVDPRQSAFTILDGGGASVHAGTFDEAYPEHVPPGGTAYLEVEAVTNVPGTEVADYATVTADVRYEAVDPPDTVFTVSGIKLKAKGSGLVATGFLTATADVPTAAVAVICLDAKGVPLGMTSTDNYHLIQNVTTGQQTGFETSIPTLPLEASHCAELASAADEAVFQEYPQ